MHLAHLAFHPAVEDRLPKFPTISEFERGYFALGDVTVQGIRGYSQILRRLSYVHHFARFTHEERHPGARTAPKTLATTSHSNLRCGLHGVLLVQALLHSQANSVKRFSPEVVLRTQAISGIFRVLPARHSTNRHVALQMHNLLRFLTKKGLYKRTVILCSHSTSRNPSNPFLSIAMDAFPARRIIPPRSSRCQGNLRVNS